ncbi:MAG: oxygen-independent coproporphyrinogen III oxidase [Bacteroidales bacterium]
MINKKLIKKYHVAGPRYTSYPPANHFSEAYTENDYVRLLKQSNEQSPGHISVYIHVPFCPQICHFCGCNTNVLKNSRQVQAYFQSLEKEIRMVSSNLDKTRGISQIHWGGGTPNSMSYKWIEQIMALLYSLFSVETYAEIAMEVNPAYLNLGDLLKLREMGFNRISLGIQDFNPQLLKKLNRQPSKYPVEDIYRTAKKAGFSSVNIDLIYGLPGQNKHDFNESVERVIKISPERVVTFSYAHVPWFKEHQKKLEQYRIPQADEKLEMLESSFSSFTNAGYVPIGMDHYAKPNDELAVALKNKELHRNFQGYCTKETTGQVYAFGATAISQLTDGYFQNLRSVEEYIKKVKDNKIPIFRGYIVNDKEKVIRATINEIMCNHTLNIKDLASKYDITFDEWAKIVDFDEKKLAPFISDHLISYHDDEINVTPKGFFLIRNIAMAFDPIINESGEKKYSKTI